MGGIKGYLVGFGLAALFGFALIAFSFELIGTNNPNSKILGDTSIGDIYYGLNSSLNAFPSEVNTQANATRADRTQSTISVFLILSSILELPWKLTDIANGFYSLMADFIFPILLGPQLGIVVSVIFGILAAVIVLLVIRLVRTGDSGDR